MERLTGLDAAFLYLETPTHHMHVAMTMVLDPSTMPGGYSFQAIKDFIASRTDRIPPFRRRLVSVPLNLHHPVWVEDPEFDIDYHIRRIGAPAPGGRRELGEMAAQIASIPLDRSRPLWEMWVVEGLKQDRIAVVSKVHHCAIDGASGAELMVHLFDLDPADAVVTGPPPELPSERVPSFCLMALMCTSIRRSKRTSERSKACSEMSCLLTSLPTWLASTSSKLNSVPVSSSGSPCHVARRLPGHNTSSPALSTRGVDDGSAAALVSVRRRIARMRATSSAGVHGFDT